MYWRARKDTVARPRELQGRLYRLADWWGAMSVDDVTPETCAAYARARPSQAARTELQTLSAAIGLAWRNAALRSRVPVTLPPSTPPRDRWLTRSEAARLLWQARRYPHAARFILVGLYTGTRSSTIVAARMQPSTTSGWIDLDAGIWHRKGSAERETKKRRPTIRIPDRLLAHIRRWHRLGLARMHLIERAGRPVRRLYYQFETARDRAGLGKDVTPHTLRHTCATWLMQAGVPVWEAAGYLGMTEAMLSKTYGHHHPDHQGAVHRALKGRK